MLPSRGHADPELHHHAEFPAPRRQRHHGRGRARHVDSYWGLIAPNVASVFGIFLLRQYMKSAVPDELIDAARIDGAGHFRIYWRVVMPLCKPALAAVAIFTFQFYWGDLLGPLIIISSSELYTLPLGLTTFVLPNRSLWNLIMAGSVLSTIPLIDHLLRSSNGSSSAGSRSPGSRGDRCGDRDGWRRQIVSAVLAGLVATGCISFGATDDGNGTSGTPSPQEAAVRLTSTGGDVFAWTQRIEGVGDCASSRSSSTVRRSSARAAVANGGFSFTVPVRTGEQRVAARCDRRRPGRGNRADRAHRDVEPRPSARIAVRVVEDAIVLDGSPSEPFAADGIPRSRALRRGRRTSPSASPPPMCASQLQDGYPRSTDRFGASG